MKWFNKERLKKILTFPVETVNLLNNGEDCDDTEWRDFVAEMWSEGASFFCYTSDSVDALASCCYSKDTEVLVKDSNGAYRLTFEELKNKKFAPNGYRIFNNGKWSSGKLVELPPRKMYKITTSNNKIMVLTDNHRNNCLGGMKLTKDLTTDDYIMFNSTPVNTYPEKDLHLTYEQGMIIGVFLGDGSFGSDVELSDGTVKIFETNFSLSKDKLWLVDILNKGISDCGISSCLKVKESSNNVISARISSEELVKFITLWTDWHRGTYSYNKRLNLDCVLQSIPFRRGIVDGWFATDGNMKNPLAKQNKEKIRGYSTSLTLIKDMETLCTSLGIITSYSVDDREEKPVFRGIEYNKNYPVFCLSRYAENNHSKMLKDVALFRDNSYYFRIKSIEEIDDYTDSVYCFEMDDISDDKFTLPNGIHNYNCRLKNTIQSNVFSYTLGAGGLMTGSKGVITININRLVQDVAKEHGGKENITLNDISVRISEQVSKLHKYMTAYNEILKDNYNARMLPVYDAGYISLEKQFLTLGINGFVEGAEFLGIEPTPNDDYFAYGEAILKPIFDLNIKDRTEEIMFNTEFVPKVCGDLVA